MFTPRIRSILALLLLVAAGLVLAGCRNIETQQKSGTALTRGTEGEYRMVTYVSPEEYERLTPAERERLNATVGFKVRMPIRGSGSRDASEVDQADLEQAAKDVNRRPRER